MRARPDGAVLHERGADSGSDRHVGERRKYPARTEPRLRVGGSPDVGLNARNPDLCPLLEVTGETWYHDVCDDQALEINEFRHADADRRALVQDQLRTHAAKDHDKLAANAGRSERRLRRKDFPEEDLGAWKRDSDNSRLRAADVNADREAPSVRSARERIACYCSPSGRV